MKKTKKIICAVCALLLALHCAPLFFLQSRAAEYAAGDVIEFGAYPQTQVADEDLLAALNAAGETAQWQSLGYNIDGGEDFAFYKDVTYEGTAYRACMFTAYRGVYGGATTVSTGHKLNGIVLDTVYWFRFDPIAWTVLDPESGLLIANSILDAQAVMDIVTPYSEYDNETHTTYYYGDEAHQYYLNNYAHGTIRTWLNATFAKAAFSAQEQAAIVLREQDNSTQALGSSYLPYECENTSDPVFLFSAVEARDASLFTDSAARVRNGTDYAMAQGLYNYGYDAGIWTLRSPGSPKSQWYVNHTGGVYAGIDSNGTDTGICPAIYLDFAAYDALQQPDTPEDPTPSPYDTLAFSFENGILTVSGEGEIPAADSLEGTPLAEYAENCRVIVLEGNITKVGAGAFTGYNALSMLILNAPVTLESGAFAGNGTLTTVICHAPVQTAADSFGAAPTFFEPKDAPHTGSLPAGTNVLPYAFADGTLVFDGSAEMDIYALLDLMTVMCGYYDNVQWAQFDSYTSLDSPFYVYNVSAGKYVAADNDTLNGVRFSVKVSGETDWQTVTFNEFCQMAADGNLDTFHLAADLKTGEEVKENAFQIFLDNVISSIRNALKWIVGLLNFLFNALSKFRKV